MKTKTMKRTLLVLFCMLCVLALPKNVFAAPKASIKITASTKNLKVGDSLTIKAKVTGKSSKVSWKSSNSKVLSVKKGKVEALKNGKATITAKANGKTAKITFKVKKIDYKKLYKELLSNSTLYVDGSAVSADYFCVLNIDQKAAPELIVKEDSGIVQLYYIYTIKNGQLMYVGLCAARATYNAQLDYNVKYKGLRVSGWINGVGGSWSRLYGMDGEGNKLVCKYNAVEYHGNRDIYCFSKSEDEVEVSKKKYESACKKYFAKKDFRKCVFQANTGTNREKM